MRRSRRSSLGTAVLAVLAALAAPATVAGAQQGAGPVAVGETVQLRTHDRDARGRRVECDAKVAAVAGDTLVLENVGRWYPCPRRSYAPAEIATLRVQRGHRGSRLAHAGLGLLIGATAGGVVGRVLAGDQSCPNGCEDPGLEAALLTLLGITIGGPTGLLIGASIPAGPQWVEVPGGPNVRVAVRAGVHLRVGGR